MAKLILLLKKKTTTEEQNPQPSQALAQTKIQCAEAVTFIRFIQSKRDWKVMS